ncbi:MAG: sigma-70 family RNA polymerase sigma factor [Odoribacteraceae bacterium]|jgi:RNA polymerase sigma-70 factor (ECF subfamily)|nr:sigma-70 family RNA polymerase sigma factor [Odoribacteraceae bacterium]
MDNDHHILHLLRPGGDEQKAFRLLVAAYGERLYWHVRKIVIGHQDADDVLQNTFIRVWRGLADFRHEARLYTWMYRVATNEALNFLQERRRDISGHAGEITTLLEERLESDPYFRGDDIQRELQKAILALPERQRLVFNMKYFDGMKYEHIAAILGVTVGTLKATYHAAAKKVGETLKLSDTIIS